MNTTEEIWLPIVGYEGLYEISDFGNVRSLYREGEFNARWGVAKMRFPAKKMKISTTAGGYCYLTLSRNSECKKHLLHRLVMLVFVGKDDRQVNHKDGNKLNNNLSNLEYCTPSENLIHASRVLGTRRGDRMANKIKEKDVLSIRADRRLLREIAKDYGVTPQAICLVKKKKNFGWIPDPDHRYGDIATPAPWNERPTIDWESIK